MAFAADDPHMIFDNNGTLHFRTLSNGTTCESKEYIEIDEPPFYRIDNVNGVTSKNQLQVEIVFTNKVSNYDLIKNLTFNTTSSGVHNVKIFKSKDQVYWKQIKDEDISPTDGKVTVR